MGQMNRRPSVWCSKYFFHDFLQNSLQKSFQYIFLFFYKITKIKIKSCRLTDFKTRTRTKGSICLFLKCCKHATLTVLFFSGLRHSVKVNLEAATMFWYRVYIGDFPYQYANALSTWEIECTSSSGRSWYSAMYTVKSVWFWSFIISHFQGTNLV